MNSEPMTLQQIRTTGISLLTKHMGVVATIRFLQQYETGHGDYSKDRHDILGNPKLEDLVNEIEAK